MTLPQPISTPVHWLSPETLEECRKAVAAAQEHERATLAMLKEKGLRTPHEL